jgi:cytochrome P450 family 12
MRKIRTDKSEMPGNFFYHVNTWSLESVVAIVLETRLNALSGKSDDAKAQIMIEHVRKFFEQIAGFETGVSVWKYYETKAFKELMQVFDTLTK